MVGINRYPQLREQKAATAADLGGCVADAQAMAKVLSARGFEVTALLDAQATRGGIVDALRKVSPQDGELPAFVFYFAGYGTRGKNGVSALLPADALAQVEEDDLPSLELYDLVRSVRAQSHTVFLDAAFNGSLSRLRKRPDTSVRSFQRAEKNASPGTQPLILVPYAPAAATPVVEPRVCYFTAARGNEAAREADFDGQRRGLFTYFLALHLAAVGDRIELWKDLQAKVAADVVQHSEDNQHPTLSPAFADVPLFGAAPKAEVASLTSVALPDNTPTVPIPDADALVIGINSYPNLKDGDLEGCVNDARSMSEALARYKMKSHLLLNAQATREGILRALAEFKRHHAGNRPFVLFYSGHTARSRLRGALATSLLAGDSREAGTVGDIDATTLQRAVAAIPASSRVIVADVDFAGGLMMTSDRVGYVLAARSNETCTEDDFDGAPHGVFTHFLLPILDGKAQTWSEIQARVMPLIVKHTDNTQHPLLSPLAFDSQLAAP